MAQPVRSARPGVRLVVRPELERARRPRGSSGEAVIRIAARADARCSSLREIHGEQKRKEYR